jgi:cyclopropane-fatty-acyl-phospholipid synthase
MADASVPAQKQSVKANPPGSGSERTLRELFEFADIQIGGSRPWDVQVHRDRMYGRVVGYGSVGLGESYMDGDWDCPALDQMFDRIITNRLADRLGLTLPLVLLSLSARLQNRQTIRRSKTAADVHYDLPVDIRGHHPGCRAGCKA